MRILFDQNVPDPLRRSISKHQVQISDQLGWGQLKNGVLLRIAEEAGFDVMVTADATTRVAKSRDTAGMSARATAAESPQ